MPEQTALREALHDLVADVDAGDELRRRVAQPARSRRPLLLAAAILAIGLVAATLNLVHDDHSTPVITEPGVGWKPLAPAPLGPRDGTAVAWTGTELLAWGGGFGDRAATNEGTIYDPAADRWRAMADAPIEGRFDPVSAWTGTELLVWGGASGTVWPARGGAAYDPATDRWRVLPPAPFADRSGATGVWTGHELVVWGGGDTEASRADGAAYDPATDRWRAIAPAPISARIEAYGAWTGDAVLIHGGLTSGPGAATDGARYDPAADRWERLPDSPMAARVEPTEVWTGHELVVWGGFLPAGNTYSLDSWQDSGAVLDPITGTWRAMRTPPPGRRAHAYRGSAAVPVGDAVALWPDGLLYRPASDRWEALPPAGVDAAGPAVLAAVGSRLYVWAIGPVPGVAANDYPAMHDQRVPGASIAVPAMPARATAPGAATTADCGAVDDLTPTYVTDELLGAPPTSAPGIPRRWSGRPDAYVELRTDARAEVPDQGDTIRFLEGRALLGPVGDDLGIATPCGYHLTSHGISGEELRRFAEGLVHGRQPFAIWPESMAIGLNVGKLETWPWRLDPRRTATRFAAEVLGWPRPAIHDVQTAPDGASAVVDLRNEGHDEVVRIGLMPKVGGRWWSVTSVNIGETDPNARIRIDANSADIGLDLQPHGLRFATAEVLLRLGAAEQRGSGGSAAFTFRFGPPLDLADPGEVLVLLKDAGGQVLTAWGLALPAGPVTRG